MNIKEVEVLKKQACTNYTCDCINNKNKPVTFVCIACGKCYHSSCILKIKDAIHIKGNAICCCDSVADYNEQDIVILNNKLFKEKQTSDNYSAEIKSLNKINSSLIEELNEIHNKYKDNDELCQNKVYLNNALEKIKDLNEEKNKLDHTISDLRTQINNTFDDTSYSKNYTNDVYYLKELINTKNELYTNTKDQLEDYRNKHQEEVKLLNQLNQTLTENNKLLT